MKTWARITGAILIGAVAAACGEPGSGNGALDPTGGGGGGGGGGGSLMTAHLVATDMSAPVVGGFAADVSGTVTVNQLTVELWDGQQWLLVVNGTATADFAVADATAEATLMPATQIPAATYTKARLTAQDATLDLSVTVGGQPYEAVVTTPLTQPLVIEKDIDVVVNADGSRTFRLMLETIQSVSLSTPPAGSVALIDGDFGLLRLPRGGGGPVLTVHAVATDMSAPVVAGVPVPVSGTVTADQLTVELWDGLAWLLVVDGSATATFAVGDAAAEATLFPATDIPAGTYPRARITAQGATLDLTLDAQGHAYSGVVSTRLPQPIVIEKDIEVVENTDGSRTFRIMLETVASVSLTTDRGVPVAVIDGDFGSGSLSLN